jgi:hypothetical protein
MLSSQIYPYQPLLFRYGQAASYCLKLICDGQQQGLGDSAF